MELTLKVKLASLVVHGQEVTDPGAHQFDLEAMRQLVNDPEVKAWLASLDRALLPVKRS